MTDVIAYSSDGSIEWNLADATTANRRAPAMRRAMPTLLLINFKGIADALNKEKQMDNAGLLVVAMAHKCRELIEQSKADAPDLPQGLHPSHLLWMSEHSENHAEEWPITKLHRWIGFVQCGMMANGMLDFDGAKAMFDDAKNAYGESDADADLIDHLDPSSSFKMDIGGQG